MSAKARLHHLTPLEWSGTNKNKTHCVSHLRHWTNKFQEHDIECDTSDSCHVKLEHKYSVDLGSFSGRAKHRVPTQFNIFTDGSKIAHLTGSGYSIRHGRREISHGYKHLPDHGSVFQAEVTAISLATQDILKTSDIRFVKIFVDSQATIRALCNPIIRSRTVWDAVRDLNKLADRAIKVTIVWIPAHKGHQGNERADALAKAGALSKKEEDGYSVPKSSTAIKNDIKAATLRDWTSTWMNQTTANHTRSFYRGPNPSKARYVYKLARLELGRFVRLITGHNNLNFFQTKIRLWHDPLCRFCGQGNETISHLLGSCPCFYNIRCDIFGSGFVNLEDPWSVRELLRFSYHPDINCAFEGHWGHGDYLEGLGSLDVSASSYESD